MVCENERVVVFPFVKTYRSSASIDSIVDYWLSCDEVSGVGDFRSRSHFVRCAIIAFDRLLKKKCSCPSVPMKDLSVDLPVS